jgi:hypothetical protein
VDVVNSMNQSLLNHLWYFIYIHYFVSELLNHIFASQKTELCIKMVLSNLLQLSLH